jgi:hypothetical protein
VPFVWERKKWAIARREKNIEKWIGVTVGFWKVLSAAEPNKRGQAQVNCLCLKCNVTRAVKTINDFRRRRQGRPGRWCWVCALKITHDGCRRRPYEALFNRLKLTSKTTKRAVLVTYEEFFEFTKQDRCHYCHAPIKWTQYHSNKKGDGFACNLDRMDNNRGYEAGNVVVCCIRCNKAKGNRYTYDEWYAMSACFRDRLTKNPATRFWSTSRILPA